jgi:putative nucleotidyltransferase with HDIG domain
MASKVDSPAIVAAQEPQRPWALSTPPPFPPAAIRIMSILNGEDEITINKIVQFIQSDPAFAAEVLRVANSALFGGWQKVASVQKAVVLLGLDFVKALAITVGMRAYVRSALQVPVLRSCWNHSLATALLSQELAVACLVPGSVAYTAGLLHDIGRIGLMACYPVEYGNMLSVSADNWFDILQSERDLFDLDHCQAGAWLAGEWGLPPDIALAAEHHHDEPAPYKLDVPNLVALGCRLADSLGFKVVGSKYTWTLEEIHACLPEAARNRFHLDAEALTNRVTEQLEAIA